MLLNSNAALMTMYFHNGFIYHYSYWIKWNGALTYGINGTTGAFQGSAVLQLFQGNTYTVWVKMPMAAVFSNTQRYILNLQSAAVTKTLDCTSTQMLP
jgi:hypothetical protein